MQKIAAKSFLEYLPRLGKESNCCPANHEGELIASQDMVFSRELKSAAANPSKVSFQYPKLDYAKQRVDANLDIEERKLIEFYLEEAQRLAHIGSWACNAAGFDYWSPELFRIHGLDASGSAPTTKEYLALVHPEDRGFMKHAIEKVLADHRGFDFTKRIVRPDGEIRYIRFVGVPVTHGATFQGFVGTGMDVTEQEQSTQERQRREACLAEAQRLSRTGSFGCKASSGEMFWSEETFRIFGYDRGTKPAVEAILKRVHPDDKAMVQGQIDSATSQGKDCNLEYRLLLPDDLVKHVHVEAHAVKDKAGNLEFVGAVTDITDRKAAEERIRRQEAEFQQILDLAPQQVRVYGPGGERLYANRVALDYYGISIEEWRQTTGLSFRSSLFVHPDDRERTTRDFDANRSSGSAYESELRLRGADGNYRWFLARHNPLHDDKGQVKRWYVGLTDIDERKRAEERLQQENVALREEISKTSMFEEIVGTSPALQAVLSRISKVAPNDCTVLITGETGTGKELVARAIHRRSHRASRAFISVNCAATPRDLIASELFGHEKGAFTGATQQRPGRFELANGGTLFLDEVGELPAETQIALLRVLQEREFERVGGARRIRADVRVIAATNRDLQASIRAGSFRSDLFYRLNVFPIEIPPLRERLEDIPLVVEYFIDRYAQKAGKSIKQVNKKTLQLLQSYPWPGNIRELRNVIERSMIVCETDTFHIDENWLPRQPQPFPTAEPKNQLELPRRLEEQEKTIIEEALKESRGRIFGPKGAAAKLGIPRSTLESKIRSLKIHKNRFRTSPEA